MQCKGRIRAVKQRGWIPNQKQINVSWNILAEKISKYKICLSVPRTLDNLHTILIDNIKYGNSRARIVAGFNSDEIPRNDRARIAFALFFECYFEVLCPYTNFLQIRVIFFVNVVWLKRSVSDDHMPGAVGERFLLLQSDPVQCSGKARPYDMRLRCK